MTQTEKALGRFLSGIPNGDRLDDDQFTFRHRFIIGSLVVQAPLLFALSRFSGTGEITGVPYPDIPLSHGLVGSGLILALAVVSLLPVLSRRSKAITASLGFMSCAAVLAYFWGGFVEAHFLYFVGVGVVAMYEDWLPLILSVVYVATQHSLFGHSYGGMVYNHDPAMANPGVWGLIHAFFVLLLVGAILFQWRSIEFTRDSLDNRVDDVRTLEEQQAEIERARSEAEAQREQLDKLNETLRTEASDVATALTAIANRDLTTTPPTNSDIQAVQDISSAYREMTGDLGSVLGDIRSFADTVDCATEAIRERATDLETQQREQAGDVRELASELEAQADRLESSHAEMDDLSAVIEEISASTEGVSDETGDVAALADEGSAEAAAEAVENVATQVKTVADLTETLDRRMSDVEETTVLIDDIAEQTNILALNANIEAARADGAGSNSDGFGVVADEIKSLAEETRGHSATIQETIAETLGEVKDVREDVEQLESVASTGADNVDTVAALFDRVDESTNDLETSITEVAHATNEGAASTEQISSMINDVSDGARELARTGTTVADASESNADELSEIREEIADLRSQTATLQEELDKFTLPSTAADRASTTGGSVDPTIADD